MQPPPMKATIQGKGYDTQKATLIAHIRSDCYWNGSEYERHGRDVYLYRTPRGRYFAQYPSMSKGEKGRIEPLAVEEAMQLWEGLPEKGVDYRDAFPAW